MSVSTDPNYRIKPNSLIQRTLAVIKDDPGVSCTDISERLGVEGKRVSFSLAHLRRTKQIQNLGKHAKGAQWYPRD